jgi:diaminohydroxyphosphoribosylaminopyrimidine deaminase/5-amino-6-(5-phosphoribosylamino)uracil reductase
MGTTSPNPMVGAVVVTDGLVVGRAYHRAAGEDHAEYAALKQAGEKARGGTLYTTLEPCAHHGRVGPCTEAIISAGIARVVTAMIDPNELVDGKGVAALREAGVEVEVGLLTREAERLNEAYLHRLETGRPFVHVKVASSIDGRIATASGQSRWISNDPARKRAHELRARHDAVMIGVGTVIADDPKLTVRLARGRNPAVIVLDTHGRIPETSGLLAGPRDSEMYVATTREISELSKLRGVPRLTVWTVGADDDRRTDAASVLDRAAEAGMNSILVEGGAQVITSLLRRRLVNRLSVVLAPMILGRGIDAVGDLHIGSPEEAIRLDSVETEDLHGNLLVSGLVRYA